jgi:hypothetical protein
MSSQSCIPGAYVEICWFLRHNSFGMDKAKIGLVATSPFWDKSQPKKSLHHLRDSLSDWYIVSYQSDSQAWIARARRVETAQSSRVRYRKMTLRAKVLKLDFSSKKDSLQRVLFQKVLSKKELFHLGGQGKRSR